MSDSQYQKNYGLCLRVRKSDSQYEENRSPDVGLPISEKLGVRKSYDS